MNSIQLVSLVALGGAIIYFYKNPPTKTSKLEKVDRIGSQPPNLKPTSLPPPNIRHINSQNIQKINKLNKTLFKTSHFV